MTDKNDIHSCSYYCDRPACVKAQRDELRDRFVSAQPASVADDCVLVALHRPAEGYEDVHPELVAEDAIREGWCYDVLTAAIPQPEAKESE